MIRVLYAIFDSASGVYDGPFRAFSDPEAKRMFKGMVSNAESVISNSPEDFSLIRLGCYNETTGELMPEERHTVCTGLEIVSEMRSIEPGSLRVVGGEE